MKKKLDDISTEITYRISSCLGIIEETRYDQNIFGDIIEVDDYGNKLNDIGQIKANKLLLGEAANNGCSIFSVVDMDRETLELGEVVYDFQENDFVHSIKDFYDDLWETDILILSRIEIYPEYRGMEIGKYFIKDMYNNFIQGCGLFVLKCFPSRQKPGYMTDIRIGLLKWDMKALKKINPRHSKSCIPITKVWALKISRQLKKNTCS